MGLAILNYREKLMSENENLTTKFHLRNEIFQPIEQDTDISGFCKMRFLTFHCFLPYKFRLRNQDPEIQGLVTITT